MAQFCSQCGAPLNEGQAFCSFCGSPNNIAASAPQPTPAAQQPYTQQPVMQQQPAQPYSYGTQPNYSQYNPAHSPLTQTEQLPMKWYKFVINFQLFAACIFGVISAILLLTGAQYEMLGASAKDVYRIFPDLEAVDMIYGILTLGTAIFAIFVRTPLKEFRQNGPKLYYIFLAVNLAVSFFYTIGYTIAIEESRYASYVNMDASSNFSSLAISIALLVCNINYFKKRQHLFIN